MTEEIIQTQELDEKAAEEAKAQFRKDNSIRRAYGIGIIFLVVSIASDILNLFEYRVWQIPAESLGDLASLVVLIFSYTEYRKGKFIKAERYLPVVIMLTYTTGELFLSGSLVYNLISGLLLLGVAYFIFEPKDGRRWVVFSIAHVIGVFIFGAISVFPKYTLDLGTTNAIITTGITILLLWQLTRRFQIRSIQTRLLLILLGVSMIPIVIVGIVSTLIDIQRDTVQAETTLETVSRVSANRINSWIAGVETDMETLQQNELFVSYVENYIQGVPTEAFRRTISDYVLLNLQVQKNSPQNYETLSLLRVNGDVLFSTSAEMMEVSFMNLPGYNPRAETLYFSTPEVGTELQETELYVFFPLKNGQNEVIAVIQGKVNLDSLVGGFSDTYLQLGETGEAYLVNTQNQLLTPLRNSPEIELGSVLEFGALTASQEDASVLTYENYYGENVLGIRTPIPELDSALIVEQTTAEAFNFLRLSVVLNVVISVLTLMISITAAVINSRSFTTPIESLSEAARKILRGEEASIPEFDRGDEIGELSSTLNQMTDTLLATTTNLEQTVAERTAVLERRASYLETTSLISRATTGIYDLNALLNNVTQLISENFGYYHVGIFLNDEEEKYTILRSTNSEGGWKMLARNHKLEIGTQGIVGYVSSTGKPRVQQQVSGEDSVYFDNPDLPETRSEMALPLKVGDQIFGALDVQSKEEQAFSEEDVSVLQVLADTVAVSILNTRLVEQLRENLEAERRLYGEISRETWAALLRRSQQGYSVRSDKSGTQLVTSPATETGKLAMKEKMPIIGSLNEEINAYPAALPVTVRGGVTIGVIETHKPEKDGPWTQEEVSILETVASEMGLALDNARLFEETQRRAYRDRIAAELSTKIWASSDMENILQTTVRELGSALNVSQGQIRLSLTEEATAEMIENLVDGANQS
ncbi:MAG: GAF domain-containing protein [Anaerolineales bacterium]|nr:GAF domain-containing protein [Anaerolineales bacterium]